MRIGRIVATLGWMALSGPVVAGAQAIPGAPAAAPAPPAAEDTIQPPFSPRGALLRSMVIPGWGQAYVGSPTRGAVYFSMVAGSLFMTYVSHRQLVDTRREEEWLRETGQLEENADSNFALARGRHFEDWATLSVFLFFLSGADAYVTAYLADFNERVGVMPGSAGGVKFRATLPVGGSR